MSDQTSTAYWRLTPGAEDGDEAAEAAQDAFAGDASDDDLVVGYEGDDVPGAYEHDEDEADFEDDDPIGDLPAAGVPVATRAADQERLDDIEEALAHLAAAHVTRESRKVRRKVKAAGAGASLGATPIVLQLAGALHISPEVASTISTVVALLGAVLGGYLTPERTPPLPDDVAHDLMSKPHRHHQPQRPGRRRRHRAAA